MDGHKLKAERLKVKTEWLNEWLNAGGGMVKQCHKFAYSFF